MATEALNKLDKVLSDKTSLKDVNDDVQVLLEFAQAMTDYLSRINDNQHATNREVIKSDYLGDEIGRSEIAITMLDKYLNQAVALLEKAQR
ncbi:MAG: hypothetical protein LKI50_02475 [Leuconostoc mesenteroides]|jgi:hypothetical protein|uniref:hypothetical protein n=1 Tax=Leuconostoc mesenteroides TaxID=1245 RepID=UPI002072FC49|nr:hypothetical protein [Leuconostoc mesenteroides]MCI1689236.1 hypothetical protein [Leuconostoc mesenteroides]MCM6827900.1 hypothetical protein [Leuconostoc mesenteroides]MCS8585802.1 hypothetical protein [Leuconostoc mesenteroides]